MFRYPKFKGSRFLRCRCTHLAGVQVPAGLDLEAAKRAYPVKYEESMNTVLQQEIIRYNGMLIVIYNSLVTLRKAIKGVVVMSEQLEKVASSMFNNNVPAMWETKAYPSHK